MITLQLLSLDHDSKNSCLRFLSYRLLWMTLRPRIKQLHQLHHASDCALGDVSMFANPLLCSAESVSLSRPLVLAAKSNPRMVEGLGSSLFGGPSFVEDMNLFHQRLHGQMKFGTNNSATFIAHRWVSDTKPDHWGHPI